MPDAPGLGIESLNDEVIAAHLDPDDPELWEPTDAGTTAEFATTDSGVRIYSLKEDDHAHWNRSAGHDRESTLKLARQIGASDMVTHAHGEGGKAGVWDYRKLVVSASAIDDAGLYSGR